MQVQYREVKSGLSVYTRHRIDLASVVVVMWMLGVDCYCLQGYAWYTWEYWGCCWGGSGESVEAFDCEEGE